MQPEQYHNRIIDYYRDTENAYRDSWDLDRSLAIHYGYKDEHANNFSASLLRMNAVMMDAANITSTDHVLDAGCGVGGSSIYMATNAGCKVTGITLSKHQAEKAQLNAEKAGVKSLVSFMTGDYSQTYLQAGGFDVIWGCESICYAYNKEEFIKEAFRLLRPGGRLVVADGFVTAFENNSSPVIRKWLNGWQVNYLETIARFEEYIGNAGFVRTQSKDISVFVRSSALRLYRFYWLARLYVRWKRLSSRSYQPTDIQLKNIDACKYQYQGLKRRLWQYGLITAVKP